MALWDAGGRIGRDEFLRANGFFGWVIAGTVVALIATTALTKLGNAMVTVTGLAVILLGLLMAGKRHLQLIVRRLHDLGVTGWVGLPVAIGWLWIVAAAFAAIADALVPGSALSHVIPAPQTWLRGLVASPRAGDVIVAALTAYYVILMGALLLLGSTAAGNRYGVRPQPETTP